MFVARYLKLIASVIVAAVLMMAVVVPMVYNQSMETTTITNEGAGWARFAYNPSGDYSESFTTDGSNITIGTQTGTASDMIVYATDVFSIVHADNSFHLIAPGGSSADLGAAAGVASASGVITVTDSSNNAAYSTDAATWAYVPDAAGDFGFFTDSGATIKDNPVAAAGSFAGAYTYNTINSLDYSWLAPTYSLTNGVFTTGSWEISNAAPDNLITVSKKFNAVVYTDGDWSFSIYNGNAYITKYSGPNGDVVFPQTVTDGTDTYNVTMIAGGNAGVFTPTFTGTITVPSGYVDVSNVCRDCPGVTAVNLPDTVTNIGSSSFLNCTGITQITLPSSLEYIQLSAFMGSGITQITLPSTFIAAYSSSFENCSSLKSVIVQSNATFSASAFTNSGVETILNLGGAAIEAGQFGLSDNVEIRDNIPSMGYIAPLSISEQTVREGVLYDVLALLPVMILVGVMMGVVALFLANRRA